MIRPPDRDRHEKFRSKSCFQRVVLKPSLPWRWNRDHVVPAEEAIEERPARGGPVKFQAAVKTESSRPRLGNPFRLSRSRTLTGAQGAKGPFFTPTPVLASIRLYQVPRVPHPEYEPPRVCTPFDSQGVKGYNHL